MRVAGLPAAPEPAPPDGPVVGTGGFLPGHRGVPATGDETPVCPLSRGACGPGGDVMMGGMDVNEVLLPGVGMRYDFATHEGVRLSVVALRSGDLELMDYESADSDEPRVAFRLNREEADTLAEILGAPRIAERFADLTKEVPGLSAGQVEVREGGAFVDRPLGETRARTRTGTSIVAIVRGEEVLLSPGPGRVLRMGDVLVVIGTRDGIGQLEQIIQADR